MSLLQKIIDQVPIEARQKGVKCRGAGQIHFSEHSDEYLSALVSCNDEDHEVRLFRKPGIVEFGCTCRAHSTEETPCEHVWAAMLQGEAQGFLQEWDMPGKIVMSAMGDPVIEPVKMKKNDDGYLAYDDINDDDEDSVFDDEDDVEIPAGAGVQEPPREPVASEDWKRGLLSLRQTLQSKPVPATPWPANRQLLYVIDVANTLRGQGLTIELMGQDRRKDGSWGKIRHEALGSHDSMRLPDRADAEIIAILGGADRDTYGFYYSSHDRASRYRVPEIQSELVVRKACETGRCRLRMKPNTDFLVPIAWDDTPWEFWVTAQRDEQAGKFILAGELRAGEQRMPLDKPLVLIMGGLFFTETHAARFDHNNAFQWVSFLRRQGTMSVPLAAGEELLGQLLTMPELPRLDLPTELTIERVPVTPKPRLRVKKGQRQTYSKPKLYAQVSFDYDGQIVAAEDEGQGIYQQERRRMILRDHPAERAAITRLRMLGLRDQRRAYLRNDEEPGMELSPSQLPAIIRTLLSENWYVEADGQLYRQPGEFKMEVSSGIDWFELHGNVDFDGQVVALPELLRALRRGEKTIRLDDGTFGVLPEAWLQKYGFLAGMGEEQKDHVRFAKAQVGLLDAMLLAQPEISADAVFHQARERLRNFSGVRSAEAPASFVGTLRPYQREGLGWLEFLREFGFGGCLADDMGLGKTVQVLALLEERRLLRVNGTEKPGNGVKQRLRDGEIERRREKSAAVAGDSQSLRPSVSPSLPLSVSASPTPGPSLVVAPRSLVFNWKEEATRFSPQLRVLDHTGIGRAKDAKGFKDYDLILTTYGTLRNDIAFMKDIRFDYVVLDEAQAVKNAASESAKAARLLSGNHRLALSGTPVQNHLGELWSLFEFLNPGMLGSAKAFQLTTTTSRVVDESTRLLLSRALRPFILRRTKAQVAQELPQRLEQTIHCELDTAQRKQYDDLKEHYRQSLLSKIAAEGIAKNKIQVLEALLRLRQAACHPGLLDKSRVDQSSAKLDALIPQLLEVLDGGHKALVFSQFTSLLAIVRSRLDKEKIKYVYLDGKTRDRQEVVQKFQSDDETKLFLISLKAGGVGLNLTAAEYVFLLDPWWNPAVEAQAIDRAHRIGQTRQVFAYRLIAKDTVEEKVLMLQNTKRELADAIINADNSVIGKLGREDLELLLS